MAPKIGLLLVNLGSPDSPTPTAVRKYLSEFLHDRRVITTSRWIWCPILHGIILRTRPARSARLYQKIWGDKEGEAPLIRTTRLIADGLAQSFGRNIEVEIAMRYGQPSLTYGLDELKKRGCQRIAVLPLYPQFAGATTASVYDGIGQVLKGCVDVPDMRIMRHYYDDPAYISALATSLMEHVESLDFVPDMIVASYHGLPQKYVDAGDPYAKECERTTELLTQATSLDTKIMTSYQSRFGPLEWLKPYTNDTLINLAETGAKKIVILTPGFAADCLETLEEINIEARQVFLSAGGTHFSYCPCLNDQEIHISALAQIVKRRLLSGWLDS